MSTEDIRIGLISDSEGNVRALEAALGAMRRRGCDTIVHAGDILECPYSPDPPGETIALLRSEDVGAIPGNHDRYLMDWGTPRWTSTLWMRLRRSDPVGEWIKDVSRGQSQISPEDLEWLRALLEEFSLTDGVWVCHGMPGNPWNSIWPRSSDYDANVSDLDLNASLSMLADLNVELVLCGHVAEPREYLDRLPDGRPLRIVRSGPRDEHQASYSLLTRTNGAWSVTWDVAPIEAKSK